MRSNEFAAGMAAMYNKAEAERGRTMLESSVILSPQDEAHANSRKLPVVSPPEYEVHLFDGDWTVVRVTRTPVAIAYTKRGAEVLIEQLKVSDRTISKEA